MLIISALVTFIALVITVLIVGANGMSDAPGQGFQGGSIIVFVWVVTVAFWCGWYFG